MELSLAVNSHDISQLNTNKQKRLIFEITSVVAQYFLKLVLPVDLIATPRKNIMHKLP